MQVDSVSGGAQVTPNVHQLSHSYYVFASEIILLQCGMITLAPTLVRDPAACRIRPVRKELAQKGAAIAARITAVFHESQEQVSFAQQATCGSSLRLFVAGEVLCRGEEN